MDTRKQHLALQAVSPLLEMEVQHTQNILQSLASLTLTLAIGLSSKV